MEHYELQLDGMTCNACSAVIKSELQTRPDVSCVETDRRTGKVTFIIPDSTAETTVEANLEMLGYEVVNQTLLKRDEVSR